MTPLCARSALAAFALALAVSTPTRAQIAAPFPANAGEPAEESAPEEDAQAPDENATSEGPTGADQPWCVEGMEALTPTLCHYSPAPAERAPDTLVIFLHGVVKYGTTWQWNGERAVARAAKANGFEAIMPRGRLGAGSKKFADHWNWPSSVEGQKQFEEEVLAEWASARKTLEERNGHPFAHVYVFGFSAGAYYATSLALRGRLSIDGYGVFAGGAAPAHAERWAKGVHPKPPIYVGFGYKDRAHKDPEKLGRALKAMGWKHKIVGRKGVGHSMTDAQVREALQFLAARSAEPERLAHSAPAKPSKSQTKGAGKAPTKKPKRAAGRKKDR